MHANFDTQCMMRVLLSVDPQVGFTRLWPSFRPEHIRIVDARIDLCLGECVCIYMCVRAFPFEWYIRFVYNVQAFICNDVYWTYKYRSCNGVGLVKLTTWRFPIRSKIHGTVELSDHSEMSVLLSLLVFD